MAHVARRSVAGILLAGGASSRMGQDKATMEFVGAPMISWCAAALAECAPTLFVVSANTQHAALCKRAVEGAWPRFTGLRGVEVVPVVDHAPGKGPLGGLAAGLIMAKSESVVVSACDTPLVPAAFYRNALAALPGHDGVMAHLEAPEPLISAWRRAAALPDALRLAAEGRGPRALAETLKVRLVKRDELAAFGAKPYQMESANTPEAFAKLAAWAAQSHG